MSGTEWTEPGQGATAKQLAQAIVAADSTLPSDDKSLDASDKAMHHVRQIGIEEIPRREGEGGAWKNTRTNLRLTGEPLQPADIERIAQCK